MDTIIEKISEIESAATAIMDDANERKKAYSKEMEERTAEYDAGLDAETADRINEIRRQLDADIKNRLQEQKDRAQSILDYMDQQYTDHHITYVNELFDSMIKE